MAVSALARLSFHYDRQDLREAAIGGIRAYGRQMARYPRAFAKSLAAVDLLAEGPIELAFVGAPNDPGLEALQLAVREVFLPHRVIASSDGTGTPSGHPLLAGKELVEGRRHSISVGTFPVSVPSPIRRRSPRHCYRRRDERIRRPNRHSCRERRSLGRPVPRGQPGMPRAS